MDKKKIEAKVRQAILEIVPEAVETISYGIPTFKINGKNLVHFALYKNHLGFYPTPSAMEHFVNDLRNYKTSKGAVQFPLDQPIPLDLIKKITKFRLSEITK